MTEKNAGNQPLFTARLIILMVVAALISGLVTYWIISKNQAKKNPYANSKNVFPMGRGIPVKDWKPGELTPVQRYTAKHVHPYISKNQKPIKDCYFSYRGKLKRPQKGAKVTVAFNVTKSGRVVKARIFRSTLKIQEIRICILNQVSTWQLPPHKIKDEIEIQYPFFFR